MGLELTSDALDNMIGDRENEAKSVERGRQFDDYVVALNEKISSYHSYTAHRVTQLAAYFKYRVVAFELRFLGRVIDSQFIVNFRLFSPRLVFANSVASKPLQWCGNDKSKKKLPIAAVMERNISTARGEISAALYS